MRALIICFCIFCAGHVAAQDQVGVVSTLQGEATASGPGGERSLSRQSPIFAQDSIRTSRDGAVGLIFRDDTLFTIGPASEVTVDRFVFDPLADSLDFALNVTRGAFAYVSGNIAKLRPDAVSVNSPVAQIGIRGTQLLGKVADPRVYAISRGADAPVTSAAGPVISGLAFEHFGGDNLFVLLRDPDGELGSVVLTRPDGAEPVRLDAERAATRVADGRFALPFIADVDLVDRAFGGVLAAAPQPPARFLLYFESGTTALQAQGAALLDEAAAAAAERGATDISVIGHADRAGDDAANLRLSLQRAQTIVDGLTARGVARDAMTITSHGEANPLIPTADGVAEAQNRRVEVIVR